MSRSTFPTPANLTHIQVENANTGNDYIKLLSKRPEKTVTYVPMDPDGHPSTFKEITESSVYVSDGASRRVKLNASYDFVWDNRYSTIELNNDKRNIVLTAYDSGNTIGAGYWSETQAASMELNSNNKNVLIQSHNNEFPFPNGIQDNANNLVTNAYVDVNSNTEQIVIETASGEAYKTKVSTIIADSKVGYTEMQSSNDITGTVVSMSANSLARQANIGVGDHDANSLGARSFVNLDTERVTLDTNNPLSSVQRHNYLTMEVTTGNGGIALGSENDRFNRKSNLNVQYHQIHLSSEDKGFLVAANTNTLANLDISAVYNKIGMDIQDITANTSSSLNMTGSGSADISVSSANNTNTFKVTPLLVTINDDIILTESNLVYVDDKLADLDYANANTDVKVSSLEAANVVIDTAITSVKDRVSALESANTSPLGGRVTALETANVASFNEVTTLDNRLDVVEPKVTALEAANTATASAITTATNDRTGIKSRVAALETANTGSANNVLDGRVTVLENATSFPRDTSSGTYLQAYNYDYSNGIYMQSTKASARSSLSVRTGDWNDIQLLSSNTSDYNKSAYMQLSGTHNNVDIRSQNSSNTRSVVDVTNNDTHRYVYLRSENDNDNTISELNVANDPRGTNVHIAARDNANNTHSSIGVQQGEWNNVYMESEDENANTRSQISIDGVGEYKQVRLQSRDYNANTKSQISVNGNHNKDVYLESRDYDNNSRSSISVDGEEHKNIYIQAKDDNANSRSSLNVNHGEYKYVNLRVEDNNANTKSAVNVSDTSVYIESREDNLDAKAVFNVTSNTSSANTRAGSYITNNDDYRHSFMFARNDAPGANTRSAIAANDSHRMCGMHAFQHDGTTEWAPSEAQQLSMTKVVANNALGSVLTSSQDFVNGTKSSIEASHVDKNVVIAAEDTSAKTELKVSTTAVTINDDKVLTETDLTAVDSRITSLEGEVHPTIDNNNISFTAFNASNTADNSRQDLVLKNSHNQAILSSYNHTDRTQCVLVLQESNGGLARLTTSDWRDGSKTVIGVNNAARRVNFLTNDGAGSKSYFQVENTTVSRKITLASLTANSSTALDVDNIAKSIDLTARDITDNTHSRFGVNDRYKVVFGEVKNNTTGVKSTFQLSQNAFAVEAPSMTVNGKTVLTHDDLTSILSRINALEANHS